MNGGDQCLSSIAIFGQPHELWPAVALLGRSLPDYIKLTIIEDEGEATQPAALSLPRGDRLLKTLQIDIRQLMRECGGIFGLGTDLQGLPSEDGSHFVAPSGTLPLVEGMAMHHIMLRAAFMHDGPERLGYLYQPFRFAARAALAGKFDLPENDTLGPVSLFGPTLQIDRAKYAGFLKARFSPESATLMYGRPAGAEVSSNGTIGSVTLENGGKIAADLFVDVSGDVSKLHPNGPQKQAGILPFDRAISCFDKAASSAPHRHCCARAIAGGVLIETPLAGGTMSELLFSSADMDEAALAPIVGEDASADSFDSYFTDTPWHGNLVALGSASACLGPYPSADMRLLHEQALLFAAHIPAAQSMEIEAAEYNRHQMRVLEEIRDFALLPFIANRREEPVWRDLADAPPPESLQLRIDQFESRGNFIAYDHEIFDAQSWIELLIGLGITPRRFDPLARSIDMQRIQPALKNMAGEFHRTIASMTDHTEFMDHYLAENV